MKKLFISFVMALALVLTFSIVAFADIVHDETNVDYDETVTLLDGTVLPLFDENKEALIWYISGTEDGKNLYSSIRSDDQQIKWYTETWNEVTSMGITFENGTKVEGKNIVVVNMMDDDIITNHGPGASTPEATHYGKHIKGFKLVFEGWKNLEYVYLRLDHGGIYRQSFNGCSKLQYVNLEDLTQLGRIGDGSNFSNCTAFFAGKILDLSNTKITTIDNGGSFNGTSMTGVIFPSTIKTISCWTFQNTTIESIAWPTTVTKMEHSMFKDEKGRTELTTIYLSNTLTSIDYNAFLNCNKLEKIFYVGTLDELNTLLANVNTSGNDTFFAVVGENNANVISYADYLALEDKSGKYAVYNYSWCEAYNNGNHEITGTNPCVGFCSVCQNNVVNHSENAETAYTVEFVNFGEAGKKITYCTNEGCTYKVTEELGALITCRGFSVPENGEGAITVGYTINQAAIDEYVRLTGETVKYGMFAALKLTLGDTDLFDENGEIIDGVISAEMPENKFSVLNLRMFGFDTDTQKAAEVAIGAYVITENEDAKRVDYVQDKKFEASGKYIYVSYNSVYDKLYPTEE